MDRIRLGRTGLLVSRSSFGAIPIQRISFDESKALLWKSFDRGINFYDTARGYTDSEEKLGNAFSGMRKEVIIATKGFSRKRKRLLEDLETSLKNLKTDYVDILQLHNPDPLPDPGDPESAYGGLLEAKQKGMVRFIGITSHKVGLADEAVRSGLYDTLQFPLCYLSTEKEVAVAQLCRETDIGFIAMKALSGGLLTNAAAAFAYLRQYDNVVPIWGIEKEWQLDQFVAMEKDPPPLDDDMRKVIEKDREELAGSFCRACGYCLPCPANIPITMAARMSFLLARTNPKTLLTENMKKSMELINDCQDCGHCRENCPYELDTPELLRKMLDDYLVQYEKLHGKS